LTAIPKPARRGPKPRRPIARSRDWGRAAALKAWNSERKLCDDTFALYVRVRDGNRCRLCRSNFLTQCAHLISRRYESSRIDDTNAWCLCLYCHKRYTEDPLGWDALMETTFGVVEWSKRKHNALVPVRVDYSQAIIPLRLLLLNEVKLRGPCGLEAQLEKLIARHDAREGR
jgi:hypothetical protein